MDPSIYNYPILYMLALTSVMAIAVLGIGISGWMLRDTWRDRRTVFPGSLLFNFRVMKFFAGGATFLRALPEVLFLQIHGDKTISPYFQELVLTAKQFADSLALWFVVGWILLLVVIYPAIAGYVEIEQHETAPSQEQSTWGILVRPILCLVCVMLISALFALGKISGN